MRKPKALDIILVATAFVVGFLLLTRKGPLQGDFPPLSQIERASTDTTEIHQLVTVVLIADLGCPTCNSAAYKEALAITLDSVRARVVEEGHVFRSLGTVITLDHNRAFDYLTSIETRWDEMSIGYRWLNTQVMDLIWGRDGRAAVPTLVAYRSQVVSAGPRNLMVNDQSFSPAVVGGYDLIGIVERREWDRLIPR